MKNYLRAAVAALALSFSAPSFAVTHIVNLVGAVGDSSFGSFTSGPRTYFTWLLPLSGSSPISVAEGDNIQATITLDGAFTVPSSGEAFVGFNLFQVGGPDPALPVFNDGSMTFFNSGGPTGLPSDTVSTNCGNCLSNIAFLGANAPFTFDSISANFTVTQLGEPSYLVDGFSLSYQLSNLTAVPEPATWGMMILGFGMIGSIMRRKQATLVASATSATR